MDISTGKFYELKAKEGGYDDLREWLEFYDWDQQPQKIIEWTNELISQHCHLKQAYLEGYRQKAISSGLKYDHTTEQYAIQEFENWQKNK